MAKILITELFRIGNPPKDKRLICNVKHPANRKKAVRCILQNQELFFNVADFIGPYKNPMFGYAISVCLPSHAKNLKKVWAAKRAWEAIQKVVEKKLSKKELKDTIEKGVKAGTLFPEPKLIKTEEGQ
jgi:hypothetical protein